MSMIIDNVADKAIFYDEKWATTLRRGLTGGWIQASVTVEPALNGISALIIPSTKPLRSASWWGWDWGKYDVVEWQCFFFISKIMDMLDMFHLKRRTTRMPPMIKETPRRTEKPEEEKFGLCTLWWINLTGGKYFSGLEFRLQGKGFCGQLGGLIHLRPTPLVGFPNWHVSGCPGASGLGNLTTVLCQRVIFYFQQLCWLKCKDWVKFGIPTTMILNLTSAHILLCKT